MHVGDEHFANFAQPAMIHAAPTRRLQRELSHCTLSTINHYKKRQLRATRESSSYSLHKDPSPNVSITRLEQLRDSIGPPPLEVPRNVTDIVFGILYR